MCIDFRMLNKQKKNNAYLIPQIDEIFYHLCKAQVFSKIDLSKVYHQVAVEPSYICTNLLSFPNMDCFF